MGLRERQKARRRQAILEAAHGLFRERGYEATSMEHIAARAEVSLGTIYNYFDTKGALLLRIAAQHFEERIREGWPDVSDPARDPARILADFIDDLLDWGMEPLDRSLWRNIYAISIMHVAQADARAYAVMDRYLLRQIIRLCGDMAQKERLPRTVDPRELGQIAFAIGNNQWLRFLIYESVSLDEAKRAMRKQLREILQWNAAAPRIVDGRKGGSPRNVRAPRARGNGHDKTPTQNWRKGGR